jgi:probable phosphoglycerate mutase
MTSLLIVRHGETEWSLSGRHTSVTDLPLTNRGEQQAQELAPALSRRRIALVIVSPRERARRTAELAGVSAGRSGGVPVIVDEDAAEWGYGDYEGRTTEEIRADRPGWTIWTGDPPGGETAAEVSARADRLLDTIRAALAEGDVLVVGHGHFGRALAARYLDQPVSAGRLLQLDPATINELGAEHGAPVVAHWNVPPEQAL